MYNPNSTSPASPTSDEIIEVVGEIYTAFNGKLFTLDNIADAYNTYKTIIKNGGTTVDSDRVLVANETLRKINPNALSLITLKGILDPSGNGVVDDLELANALLTSRTSGFDAATKAKINDFLNKPENSSRATIIRNSVAKIDPDANGIVARSEFITNYVKYIEGKFTDAERPIVSALLQTSPKYSMLAPILNSLNLSPGADLGNNEVAAALLALRKKGTLSEQREIDTTLVALGVATRAANGVVTYDADVTKIRGAVDILAGYNGSYNNRFVPIAIDTNGEVTRNFLRYYLKEQALNWTSGDTNFPAAIKNTKVEEVTSILKSNFEYQRTKDLMTQFVSVSGTSRTFDYNSLVKILVKKNAISEPLTTDEYNYFKELIPTTAFKTANKTNALARQHEIDGLVKAISFIGTDRDLANIRTRFIASETANDISKIDFNGDSKTGTTDNVPSAPVPFTDRNLLNGVLSAMGLGPITW
jgi:hypothetical protein